MTQITATDGVCCLLQASPHKLAAQDKGQSAGSTTAQRRNGRRIAHVLLLCAVTPVNAFLRGPCSDAHLGRGSIRPLTQPGPPWSKGGGGAQGGASGHVDCVGARTGEASDVFFGRGAADGSTRHPTMCMFAAGLGGWGSVPSVGLTGSGGPGRVRRRAAAMAGEGSSNR